MKTAFLLATVAASAAAFTGSPVQHRAPTFTNQKSSLRMGGSSGYATSLEGKKQRVESIRTLLESSEMIISVPASSLTVGQVQKLRRSLPEGTTVSVVKNKLMARAVEGTSYETSASGLLKGANMWFFIEEDIGGTVSAFQTFTKENGKKETHDFLGGVIEGVAYDQSGVIAISKLPSKIELITKIAGSIKAVPTKVARAIKAPGEKTARAIKLAVATEKSD
eukprot:CAMPEP_0176490688 /NCGR_PEP_ID=MMETSP0200_2-20121128/8006_1 /TAXON_ID=947934 /ORGANISM="Chaetoceros sp., Strain GSL56" /LENGTH=221 /DNA_ID=CAMNT_0017888015 /DNA_START=19 /DNA_END=684 /DNA_ORIENTATION=+